MTDLSLVTLLEHQGIKLQALVADEKDKAIHDLLASNMFKPVSGLATPVALTLSIIDNRLHFQLHSGGRDETFSLALVGLRRTIREYFTLCDSYYGALTQHQPGQLETIDMARRGLHNEAADVLMELLAPFVTTDHCTARRLFTLLCVLYLRPQHVVG